MELNTKADQPACSDIPESVNTLNEEGRHYNDDIQKISPNSEVGNGVCKKIVPSLTSIGPDTEAHSVCVLNGEYHGIGPLLPKDSVEDYEAASSEDQEVENKTTQARDSDIFLQKEDRQGKSFGSANGGLLDNAHSVCVLNGEYRGIGTLLSMDSVDILEILREEILAAEAREFEVIENGLLNAEEVGHEEPPREENRMEGSIVSECEVTGIDRGGSQGYAEKCALQDKAMRVRDSALMRVSLRNAEDGLAVSIESPNGERTFLQAMGVENYEAASSASTNGGLLDDAFSQDIERMGAKNSDAAPSEDNKVNHEGVMSAPSEDNQGDFENRVFQHEGVMSTDVKDAGLVHGHQGADETGHKESSNNVNVEVNGDTFSRVFQHEGVMSTNSGLLHGHQDADEIGHKELSNTLNVEVKGNTFSREDEGTGTEKGNVTLLDKKTGDNGEHVLEDEMLDKLSEHSEDDDYTAGAFSGPIAFSGMLSYSGMISYSGQIPYSGNLSLHSDSSTSTRSFAFPILASDWNSSPAKIGPPDGRFFRRRRRWRPRFCCRRPTTLFD